MKLSNRLFSSFLNAEQMRRVKFFSYFPLLDSASEYKLLPSDHAYYYPLTVDKRENKVKEGELNFFNKIIFEKYRTDNVLAGEKVIVADTGEKKKEKALVVNLIDNCYGHSFLKLLNLYDIYKLYQNEFDVWVLCPSALVHFVPADKFSVVNIKLGFTEALQCPDLEPAVAIVKERYTNVDYVTLDTYLGYQGSAQLIDFFGFLPPGHKPAKKYLTFYYRSDFFRTWAGRSQPKRISAFLQHLKEYFPSAELLVLGDLDDNKFPSYVKDARTNKFGKEADQAYNAYFADSHLVVGLIGSNMLQPSMMCDFTVHLVPRTKITIVAEELFNHTITSIPGWFKNIYLFGNEDLGDLKPEELCEQVILLYHTYIAKKYKELAYTDDLFNRGMPQSRFYETNYPQFSIKNAQALKERVSNQSFRKNLIKYKFHRLLKKLGIQ